MPKSKAYIGHLMILATTFIYSFNTNFMKVIIPEWIGPNGLVLLRCSFIPRLLPIVRTPKKKKSG